ncbi:hypothetical protein Btru_010087 [Bulinus truncatus]|nr:hypothetical protein Btru_010087 [Bulinus truncatus]
MTSQLSAFHFVFFTIKPGRIVELFKMSRKRVTVKPKSGSKDETFHPSTGKDAPTSPSQMKVSQQSTKDENNGHEGSTTSLIRFAFLITLLLGLAGVLFFPKLVYFAETTMGVKRDSTGRMGETSGNEHVLITNTAVKEETVPTQVDDVIVNGGDLMENEEIDNNKHKEENKQKPLIKESNEGEAKSSPDDKNKKKSTRKSDETNKDRFASKEDSANVIPPRRGKSGSGKPIILNAETSQIVLDPSQIKFVESPPETKEDGKKRSDTKEDGKKRSDTKEDGKKRSGKNVTSKQNTPSKSNKDNVANRNIKNDKVNNSIEDDIKNFQPTFHKTFTPKKIFDGGRRIPPVELLHQKPSNSSVKVYLFDDFLSVQECDGLMRAHDSHVRAANKTPILCFDSVDTLRQHIKDAKKNIQVTPNVFTPGTRCLNESFSLQLGAWMKGNWSLSTAFYPGESTFSKTAADRIQKAMGLDPKSGGKFQITSYPVGKAYKEHTDCVLDGADKRDRVVTVLMYLNDVEEGGETRFPELGIWVKPKKGRALVWNNMSPDGVCEPHSKHVASVVKKGSKYILIRWYYYKTFYSLGRRPAPPSLPPRDGDQAMVMCDVYNSGSCRWYDEWSYEHLLEYEKNKLTLI